MSLILINKQLKWTRLKMIFKEDSSWYTRFIPYCWKFCVTRFFQIFLVKEVKATEMIKLCNEWRRQTNKYIRVSLCSTNVQNTEIPAIWSIEKSTVLAKLHSWFQYYTLIDKKISIFNSSARKKKKFTSYINLLNYICNDLFFFFFFFFFFFCSHVNW